MSSEADKERPTVWLRASLAATAASSIAASYLSLSGAPFLRRSARIGLNTGLVTGVYLLFRDRLDETETGTPITKSLFAGAVSGALLGSLRGSLASIQCAIFVSGVCGTGRLVTDHFLNWTSRRGHDSSSTWWAAFGSWFPTWFPIYRTDAERLAQYIDSQHQMQNLMHKLDDFERANRPRQ